MSATDGARIGDRAVEWARVRRVDTGPWSVRYREAGRGPAVVLVHGLGVSADYWWRIGPPLAAAGHRVLALDLPGFGRTPGPAGGLSVTEQAAAVLAFADALGVASATFVGHSLSCQAVLELAAAHPGRVDALVLAAPTGTPTSHPLLHQAWALLRDVPRESVPLAVWVGRAYLQAGPRRIWRTWRMGAREDPLTVAPAVRCPALVVVGERDPVVPRSAARRLAGALPRGGVVVVAGAAHAVNYEGAPAFVRAVAGFLAAVAREPGATSPAPAAPRSPRPGGA